jgi:hypothetical protein
MSSRRAGGAGLAWQAPWRSARRPAPFVSSTRCARQRRRLHRCLRCPSKLVQTGQRLGDSHPTRHLLPCLRRATESQHRGPVLAEGERRFEHAPRPRESLDREHRERAGSRALLFKCLQCGTESTALLFEGPNGYELAVFPKVHGGLSTPHTPQPVAYYLDQAKRAQSVGANSAAVAMYRSALEHLLYEQATRTGCSARRSSPTARDRGRNG